MTRVDLSKEPFIIRMSRALYDVALDDQLVRSLAYARAGIIVFQPEDDREAVERELKRRALWSRVITVGERVGEVAALLILIAVFVLGYVASPHAAELCSTPDDSSLGGWGLAAIVVACIAAVVYVWQQGGFS